MAGARRPLKDGRSAVELSAVNRKQAEISLSLPRALLELEPRVRDEINAHISRGRLTVAVGAAREGRHEGRRHQLSPRRKLSRAARGACEKR